MYRILSAIQFSRNIAIRYLCIPHSTESEMVFSAVAYIESAKKTLTIWTNKFFINTVSKYLVKLTKQMTQPIAKIESVGAIDIIGICSLSTIDIYNRVKLNYT